LLTLVLCLGFHRISQSARPDTKTFFYFSVRSSAHSHVNYFIFVLRSK